MKALQIICENPGRRIIAKGLREQAAASIASPDLVVALPQFPATAL
jgi:hypothetical protein